MFSSFLHPLALPLELKKETRIQRNEKESGHREKEKWEAVILPVCHKGEKNHNTF